MADTQKFKTSIGKFLFISFLFARKARESVNIMNIDRNLE